LNAPPAAIERGAGAVPPIGGKRPVPYWPRSVQPGAQLAAGGRLVNFN
jgi:hypothetical protein